MNIGALSFALAASGISLCALRWWEQPLHEVQTVQNCWSLMQIGRFCATAKGCIECHEKQFTVSHTN